MNRLFLRAAILSCLLLGLIITVGNAQSDSLNTDSLTDEDLIQLADSIFSLDGRLILEGKLLSIDIAELESIFREIDKSENEIWLNKYLDLKQTFVNIMRKIELAMLTTFTEEDWENLRQDYEFERLQSVENIESLTDSLVLAYKPVFSSDKGQELLINVEDQERLTADINYRLGVLYLEQAELRYDRETLAWDVLVDSLAVDYDAVIPSEPELNYSLAIKKFQEILDHHGDSGYSDDALYNLAYIKTKNNDQFVKRQGVRHLTDFIKKYPDSQYYPEVQMRLGEYYFNPPHNELAVARTHYLEVIKYPDNLHYTNALYRLGWAYYRDNQYAEAVEYFTLTIDETIGEIEAGSYSNLMEESIENLSKSFATDTSDALEGISSAVEYIKKDPQRLEMFGGRLLKRIGNIFQVDLGEYNQAVVAYDTILSIFPYDPEAPDIQLQKIKSLQQLGDKDRVSDEKYILFKNYNIKSSWAKAQTDTAKVREANKQAEKALRDIVNESVRQSSETNQNDDFERAALYCRDYVDYFPNTTKSYSINFNLAFILTMHLNDYYPAVAENIKVTRAYPEGKHHQICAENAVECARLLMDQEKAGEIELPPASELNVGLPQEIISTIPGVPAVSESSPEKIDQTDTSQYEPPGQPQEIDESQPEPEEEDSGGSGSDGAYLLLENGGKLSREPIFSCLVVDGSRFQPSLTVLLENSNNASRERLLSCNVEDVARKRPSVMVYYPNPFDPAQPPPDSTVLDTTLQHEDLGEPLRFEEEIIYDDEPLQPPVEEPVLEEPVQTQVDQPVLDEPVEQQTVTDTMEAEQTPDEQVPDAAAKTAVEPVVDDTSHVDTAAETMIADTTGSPEIQPVQTEPDTVITATPPTSGETLYLMAVHNYLDIYPQGEKADFYLLNAGVIMHQHQDYPGSRFYLERLVAEFPNSPKREEAYKTMLDGYFISQDYDNSERLAKELMNMSGLSTELSELAAARVGESIYSKAKNLEKDEDFMTAGSQYKRVALETPDYKFADNALWESARLFMKAAAWDSAIVSFELLILKAPGSEWADKSLNNIAFIYQNNLENEIKAAENFERLFDNYRQSEFAKPALTNASINYTKLKDFTSALRVNEKYLRAYPNAEDAVQVLYENAELYLKMGNVSRAITAFADFTRKYPQDPRNIQAEYQIGNYYLDQNDRTRAKSSFQRTVQLHKEMVAKGQTGFPRFASFALNKLLEWKFTEFIAIDYTSLNTINSDRSRKENLKRELEQGYTELISFSQSEAIQAIYNLCRLDEDLARAEITQPVPSASGQQKIVQREDILAQSLPLYITAASTYYSASKEIVNWETALSRQRNELSGHIDALETYKAQEGFLVPDSQTVFDSESANLAEVEKSLALATQLKDSCTYKIAEIFYNDAVYVRDVYHQFTQVPDDVAGNREKMFYRAGVLGQLVTPRMMNTLELYRQAYVTADTVNAPPEWMERSAQDAIDVFASYIQEYHDLIERPNQRYRINHGAFRQRVRDEDYSAYDITEAPLLYLDFCKGFIDSLVFNAVQVPQWTSADAVKMPFYSSLDSVYTDALYKYYAMYADIRTQNQDYYEEYDEKFTDTGEDLYFEGMDLFELIIGYVNDYQYELLENSQEIIEGYNIITHSGDILLREMVKKDPIAFGYLVGLSIDGMGAVLTGNEDWIAATDAPRNFFVADYDFSSWSNVIITIPAGGYPDPEPEPFIPVDPDSTAGSDTLDIPNPNPDDPAAFQPPPDTTAADDDEFSEEIIYDDEEQTADQDSLSAEPPVEEPLLEPQSQDQDTVTQTEPEIIQSQDDAVQTDAESAVAPQDSLQTGEESFEPVLQETIVDSSVEMIDSQDDLLDASADTVLTTTAPFEEPTPAGPDMSALFAMNVPAIALSQPAEKAFYRYTLNIKGQPVTGVVIISADDNFALYINEKFVGEGSSEEMAYLNPSNFTVTSFLHPGENIIAIELTDPDLTGNGLWFKLEYSVMPENIDDLPIVHPEN